MVGVGDVAGERDDLGAGGELGAGGLERPRVAGVDDEAPAARGERPREREAEARARRR